MEEFNPDVVIDMWLSDKVRHLIAGPHNPKGKREEVASSSYINLDSTVMPDLEDEEDLEYESFMWQFCLFNSLNAQYLFLFYNVLYLLLARSKKENNWQFIKQSISQFHSFLVYQTQNFLQDSIYVSNVVTIILFANKHCYRISKT